MPAAAPPQAKFVGQSSFVDFGKNSEFSVNFNHSFIHVFSRDVWSESPLNFALLVLWGLGVLFPETQKAEKNEKNNCLFEAPETTGM